MSKEILVVKTTSFMGNLSVMNSETLNGCIVHNAVKISKLLQSKSTSKCIITSLS